MARPRKKTAAAGKSSARRSSSPRRKSAGGPPLWLIFGGLLAAGAAVYYLASKWDSPRETGGLEDMVDKMAEENPGAEIFELKDEPVEKKK